jgi:hypothetical protein
MHTTTCENVCYKCHALNGTKWSAVILHSNSLRPRIVLEDYRFVFKLVYLLHNAKWQVVRKEKFRRKWEEARLTCCNMAYCHWICFEKMMKVMGSPGRDGRFCLKSVKQVCINYMALTSVTLAAATVSNISCFSTYIYYALTEASVVLFSLFK